MNFISSLVLRPSYCLTGSLIMADESVFSRLVRFRKRRWRPRAASKLYYVRKPTPIDADEYQELKWRYNNYKHAMKSVRYIVYKYLLNIFSLRKSN